MIAAQLENAKSQNLSLIKDTERLAASLERQEKTVVPVICRVEIPSIFVDETYAAVPNRDPYDSKEDYVLGLAMEDVMGKMTKELVKNNFIKTHVRYEPIMQKYLCLAKLDVLKDE